MIASSAGALQIIFQDPYASLNPRMPAGDMVAEPLATSAVRPGGGVHRGRAARARRVAASPRSACARPGRRTFRTSSRAASASASASRARWRSTPAHRVRRAGVRAGRVGAGAGHQPASTCRRPRPRYLFVAHDLAVVRHISHRVAVMYLGKIVEIATRDALFRRRCIRTRRRCCRRCRCRPARASAQRIVLKGDPPNPAAPPSGCRFHTRCPMAQPRCSEEEPQLTEKTAGQWVACHFR
jgi:oligopeptide/dipeptide ABC transporter ATP-binding protein